MKLGLQILVAGCLALPTTAQKGATEPVWPARSERALFVFPTAFETLLAFDRPGAEPIFNYALEPHGLARLDGAGAWHLGHGTASAPRQDSALVECLVGAPGISVQAWLTPAAVHSDEEQTVFAYGPKREPGAAQAIGPNFELTRRGAAYTFRLRIGGRIEQVTGDGPETSPQHVSLTYGEGRLALYVAGHRVGLTEGLEGGFEAWVPGPFFFGGGSPESAGWVGALEGFALHGEALSAQEVLESANAYARRVGERRPAPLTRLLGRLVARSTVPTPEDIAPYPEALAVFEYEVLQVYEGFYLPKKMRVAHWVVLGEVGLARGQLSIGDELELAAIDFARNPQLENVNISDTLPFDFDLRLFFEVTAPLAAGGK